MKWLVLILLFLSIAGCELGRCEREVVEVHMNGTLTTNSSQPVNLMSQISDVVLPSDFVALRGAVRNAGVDQPVDELIWDLSQGLPQQGFASFSLAIPVFEGQIISMDDPALRGTGGWAVRYQRPPEQARAGLKLGSFTAESVGGTITVIDTNPLALRVNLEFTDQTQSVLLSGDMQFSDRTITEYCD